VGDIIMFDYVADSDLNLATPTNPARRPWALCDGGTYGGVVTPNLCNPGRVPKGSMSGFRATGGAATVILAMDQIPSHKHGVPYAKQIAAGLNWWGIDVNPDALLIDSSY